MQYGPTLEGLSDRLSPSLAIAPALGWNAAWAGPAAEAVSGYVPIPEIRCVPLPPVGWLEYFQALAHEGVQLCELDFDPLSGQAR
jgi:hypothetical protein